MAMIDLKRTKADKKAREEGRKILDGGGDDYPYGLSVDLDHESLDKLGMKTLPKAGDKIHLHAHAHVKSVSENHRDGGKKERHMTLELRKMRLAQKEEEAEEAAEGEVPNHAAKGAKAAMDKALSK